MPKEQKEKLELKKREGFQGQKAIIIPRKILSECILNNSIVDTLYITDIGFYPKAKFHFRERPQGSEQNILIYCLEGKGVLQIQKKKYELNPGEFIFIPAKMAHWYEADNANPWSIYWAHFKGNAADSIVSLVQKKFKGYKGVLFNSPHLIQVFEDIYDVLERGYRSDNLIYSNMRFWQFITTCVYSEGMSSSKESLEKDAMDVAIDFLKENAQKSLTLQDIAASVNLSPSHFSYLFKNKTGYPPIEYFNHLKIQQACQYLLFTQNRIKEISFELGIEDPYYFSRLFKKVMGVSPEEYRGKRKV